MKVTIKQLKASATALNALAALTGLPAATHMRVVLTLRAVRDPLAAFDTAFNALCEKYGTPVDGKPGNFRLNDPKAFSAEAEALGAEEIELADRKIAFPAVAGRISSADVVALEWLIDLSEDQLAAAEALPPFPGAHDAR